MTYRRPNGRRLGQTGLAGRIAQEINGMMLAQAFVIVRSTGCSIIINKLDGVMHRPVWPRHHDGSIHVDIALGIVKGSWPLPPT